MYYANKKTWIIYMIVDNYAAHLQHTSFLRNAILCIIHQTTQGMLQPLDMCIIKCFRQLYGKHLAHKAVCLMDSGKDITLKVIVLQAVYFTVLAWQQVT
jgi:hypothetical protein